MGSSSIVYVSVPDTSPTCNNLGLPSLPSGWFYGCQISANYRKVDGTGWIPVNFSSIYSGSPLSILPVDPVNSTSTGNYYTYVKGGSWELTALLESDKYSDKAINDGDAYPGVYSVRNSQSPLTPGIRDKGMVGYWKFDETSGTLYDSSGYGNNGTQSGGVTYGATGKVDNALSFDGLDDYVYTTNSFISPQDFTISIWFKTISASGRKIVGFESNRTGNSSGSYDRHIYMGTDGKIRFGWYSGSLNIVTSINILNDNVWHYAVGTHTSANMGSLYIDGVLQGSGSNAAQTYTGYWRVGSYRLASWTSGVDGFFPDFIDDVRIYNRALSAAEISAIYNATK